MEEGGNLGFWDGTDGVNGIEIKVRRRKRSIVI